MVNSPSQNLITNSTDVSYTLSENIYKGEFKWDRVGGVEDTLAPYVAILDADEMKKDIYSRKQLVNIPKFVENTVYTLSVSGVDRAGNEANDVVISNIEYDFTPPK